MNRARLAAIRDTWRQAANPHAPVSHAQMLLVLGALLDLDDEAPLVVAVCSVCSRVFMRGDVAQIVGPHAVRCVADSRCVAR